MCVSLILLIDPVLLLTQPHKYIYSACRVLQTEKKKTLIESQGTRTSTHLHMHTHVHKTNTHTHTCTIPKDLCACLADGAGVVSFNDGEASPGEASLSSIPVSGVFFCRLSTPT